MGGAGVSAGCQRLAGAGSGGASVSPSDALPLEGSLDLLAGDIGSTESRDGVGERARFQRILAITHDPSDDSFYVIDGSIGDTYLLRKVDSDRTVRT
jgi:hypothetical protein